MKQARVGIALASGSSSELGGKPAWRQESFWRATIPPLPSYRDRPLPARSDVVVIGGGYTGLSAAWHLARSGARVTVLEAETLGWGASSRNGGMFHGGLRWGLATLRRRYGADLGERLHHESHLAFATVERLILDEGLDCDYQRSGQLVLAWSKGHARQLEADAAEHLAEGRGARVVRGAELRAEIGTDYYQAGLVEEEAGGLHPAKFLAELAFRADRAGVDLHEKLPAVALERERGSIRVTTAAGSIDAGEVVLATNGYTGGVVRSVQQRIIPIGSYIVVTEPLPMSLAAEISPRGRMFFDTKNFLYYWRLTPDGRLLFGGRASFVPTTVRRTAAILEAAMRRVHPQLASTSIEYAWGGKVGFTFDRLPHIGRRDGVTYALGYCGSGVCMATYFGTVVAGMLAKASERGPEPSAFELIPHPGMPVVPGLYRGVPWFLPVAGELFRLQDRLGRARSGRSG